SEQKQGVILEPVNLVKYAASPPVTFPERRSPESSLDASKSGVVSLTPFGSVKEGPPEESPMEEMKGVKAPELEIEGPAKERVVLYKPPLPPYPKWAEMAGLDFDLVLKFMVNQKGEVKLVETLISSGYPQVDTLGLRYLKNWRFNPLSSEDDKAGQWGKIKIKFRLESKD
ncbi:MAG: energy transducer TonB, partial [Candidatus Omnitrophica bacterium]|nr:energy transducer TonB [Candidatus Omnitrophota bacterium]